MTSRIPIVRVLVSGTLVAACATNRAQQGRSAEPFEDVTWLVIAPDSIRHSVKIDMRDPGRLDYPERARHEGVETDAVVAFVIIRSDGSSLEP